MSSHVPPDFALILAALEPCDPERRAAWQHAKDCDACRRVLEQGQAVLDLIDAQAPHQFIDPALKQRILSSVGGSSTKVARAWWQPLGIAMGTLASFGLALLDGVRPGLHAGQGVHCVFWEVMFALVPLAVTAQVVITMRKQNPSWWLALAGVVGGVIGQVYLRGVCPLRDVNPHLLVFHCAGVVIAAALGLVVARGIRWVRG